MMDALEMNAGINTHATDADDILHYIQALNDFMHSCYRKTAF
jgi:hypothetical protein